MLNIDDVSIFTAVRDSFDPSSLDYMIANFFVTNPGILAGSIQQNQLQSVVNQCSNVSAAKQAQALIDYYQALL